MPSAEKGIDFKKQLFCNIEDVDVPFIPIVKTRGFTAHLGKNSAERNEPSWAQVGTTRLHCFMLDMALPQPSPKRWTQRR